MSAEAGSTGTAADRIDRLRASVATIRSRSAHVPIERWLLIGGAALMVLGVAAIVIGWYGASRTPYLFEQVPYLISGGLLGVALAVIGGLAYFAFWMTRMVQEARRQGEATREALARIESLLGGPFGASDATAPTLLRSRAVAVQRAPTEARNGSYVATEKGTMFHRPDCAVVAGRDDVRRVGGAAITQMKPCKMCDPLGV